MDIVYSLVCYKLINMKKIVYMSSVSIIYIGTVNYM